MIVEVLPVALVVTVLVVMMDTAAEALHLATTTIVETPTLVLPHPALAVLQSTITHRLEAVLILPMMAMVHFLQPVATRLTLTPTVMAESLESLENPGSLTAVLPALPRDASVATTLATIVDLTGDYPLLLELYNGNELLVLSFLEKPLLTHAQDSHRFDQPITTTNQQVDLQVSQGKRAALCGLVGKYSDAA